MKRYLLLILICISSLTLMADTDYEYFDYNDFQPFDNNSYRTFSETAPPPGPVRPVGEFEPASHVLIRYPLGIPLSLVAQLADVVNVICIVSSTSVQSQASTAFQNAGVNMNNVSWMIASTNTYWTRDYGPFFVINGNNELSVVDFPYNRPRPLDDDIPIIFAQNYNFPLYGMNLIQTGGNYMNDGLNTAAQTTLVYTENPSLTTNQVFQKMHDYLGIQSFFAIPDPNNNYIEHIDCWGKFLAPDKVLIRSVPTNHAQYNAIESVANYFASQNCVWGYPYKVYRVNTPNNQPYTNSLILNNNVFVPTMNSSYDAAALQSYSDALPGFNVVGVPGTSSAPWASTDALHCRTHEIPDRNMLYVHHMPYFGDMESQTSFNFNAYIYPYSQMPLYSDSIFVSYKVNQGAWQRAYLSSSTADNYSVSIGGFGVGDTIRYFIHAADHSGRSINHPLTGAADPHFFRINGDNAPPQISHTPLTTLNVQELPVTLMAYVSDTSGINSVQVIYKIDDSEESIQNFDWAGIDIWLAILEPQIPTSAEYFYYKIVASDNAQPSNSGTLPQSGWFQVPISNTYTSDETVVTMPLSILSIHPNPFSSSHQINIKIQMKVDAELFYGIYNTKGQLIRSSKSLERKGQHTKVWNGTNAAGLQVPAGIYFVKVLSGETQIVRKVLKVD